MSKDEDSYNSKYKEKNIVFHLNDEDTKSKDNVLENIPTKLDAFIMCHMSGKGIKQGIVRPYSSGWDLIPFSKNY